MILGATSNGISIASNGTSLTGTVYLDDAFVGATDLTQNMNACQTADCTTEFSAFIDTTNAISLKNVDFIQSCTGTTDRTCNFIPGVFTQTPNCKVSDLSPTATSGGANRRLHPHIMSISSTSIRLIGIDEADTAFNNVATFIQCSKTGVDYSDALNRSNGNTYSSTNADTDWASCIPTSSQGFGTPTFAVQCKRQGGDLLMKGRFTPSATTAVEARLGLPLWNGVQLISAGSSIIPALEVANGFYLRGVAANAKGGAMLIEPSVAYLTFGTADTFNSSLVNSFSKANANNVASTETLSFNARIPIAGWEQSNIIIGQFNGLESCTDSFQCSDTYSAKISSAGIVSDENLDWVNGNASLSVSTYTLTFKSGLFTVPPTCVFTTAENNNLLHVVGVSTTASNVVVRSSRTDSNTNFVGSFNIVCQKQGVDYVGKTARAVSSDQNMSSPGQIKSTMCSAQISSTGVITQQMGGCFASCTNATTPVCTFTSSYWADTPNCWGQSTTSAITQGTTVTGTTSMQSVIVNTSGTSLSGSRIYICHGARQ